MMFSFLADRNERDRVSDTLSVLTDISARVEVLSQQILSSVGTPAAKLTVLIHERMLQAECIRDMAYMGARPTPHHIIANASFRSCYKASSSRTLEIDDIDGSSVGPNGWISKPRFERDSAEYKTLRSEILELLEAHSFTAEGFFEATQAKLSQASEGQSSD
jgi:hypothetical protein